MRIACVQMDVAIGRVDENLGQIEAHLRRAADDGVQLAIFPECALTGYCFESLDEAREFAEPVPGPSVLQLSQTCSRLGVHAIVGMLEADGARVFNACVLVGPRGLVGSYRKVHLPYLGVDRFTTPGDRAFEVIEVGPASRADVGPATGAEVGPARRPGPEGPGALTHDAGGLGGGERPAARPRTPTPTLPHKGGGGFGSEKGGGGFGSHKGGGATASREGGVSLRLGMHICYDGGFPEPARVMALEGADLLALPTNWPPGAECMAEHAVRARAMENHVYYAAANRVGSERGFRFIGRSSICDPHGKMVAQASADAEQVIVAEIDPALARNKRIVRVPGKHIIDRFRDRRPELYGKIVAPKAN